MSTEFLTMAFICLLIRLSSSALHASSCSNTFGFSGVLLLCLELFFCNRRRASVTNGANTLSYNWTTILQHLSVTVFAKPPSEPKLSQLSSDEEEEEEVSMGMSVGLR